MVWYIFFISSVLLVYKSISPCLSWRKNQHALARKNAQKQSHYSPLRATSFPGPFISPPLWGGEMRWKTLGSRLLWRAENIARDFWNNHHKGQCETKTLRPVIALTLLICRAKNFLLFLSQRKATVARKKATITVIAVSVIYVICWIPVLVMYILAQSLPKHKVHSANHQITILLTMFNSSINPIVYSFTSAQFRRRIAKLFRCKRFKVYYGSRLRVYEIPQGSFKASQYESEGSTGRGVF